ncbi:cohesin domain-containing protein [Paenibacillus filicis]|uniref:Cohesin domain-containing protein n=1 Tax=Paenibacillus filicis TaxID=669464 RepID=A0ABU9DMA5_9BACL
MKKFGLLVVAVFLLLLLNVIPGAKPAQAASASSLDVSVVLHVGDSINLSAGYPHVSWKVTDWNGGATDKASVTSEGVVTAKKPGKVKVTASATDGTNYTGEILITILGDEGKPSAVLNGTVTVTGGEAFDLIYGLRSVAEGIYAQDINLTYDVSKLEFDSATSLKENAISIVNITNQQGKLRILAASLGQSNGNAASGDLIKLHWKVKSDAQPGTADVALASVVVSDGQGVETTLNSETNSHIVIKPASVNKQELLDLITQATEKHDQAVEGTLPGQYKEGSKAALKTAIAAAKSVADNASSTQQAVDQAVTALKTALQTFSDAVNPSNPVTPGDLNGDGKVTIGDIAVIAAAYGKSKTDPDWELYKKADINGDGIVDIADLAAVAAILLQDPVTAP